MASVLLYVLAWRAMAPLTFFSSDVGLRYLQVRELAANDWRSFAIGYPGRGIDAELRHVPYYYAYSVLDGQIYLNVSHFFPLLVSWLYAGLGSLGLPIVPVLGSVSSALAVWTMVRVSDLPGARWAFLITLVTTPLLFYGTVLWDHSLATACGAWAVALVVVWLANGRPARWPGTLPLGLAGLVTGLGLGQRPELYTFAIALGLALLVMVRPPWRALLGGGLIGAMLVWGLNTWWVGNPFGMGVAPHFTGYGVPERISVNSTSIPLATKIVRFMAHAEPAADQVRWAALLVAFGSTLVIAAGLIQRWRRLSTERMWRLLVAGLAVAALGYALFARIALGHTLIGVAATLPLLVLSFASLSATQDMDERQRSIHRFVGVVAAVFLGLMLLLWPGYGGLQWGARYLLPAVPLLVYLAFGGYVIIRRTLRREQRALFTVIAASLIVIGVALQGLGVRRVFVDHEPHRLIRQGLEALPGDLILTNHVFMPSFMTSIDDKSFLYVRDDAELDELLQRLAARGVRQVGVIPQRQGQLRAPQRVAGQPTQQTSLERFGPRDVIRTIVEIGDD